ncbi:MAG TPA: hypothetical protein PJ986_04635 [Gammaproteobacteria bacterium]|nr:hypothetical protein [Gammaproteobacteria bacterium]
MNTIPRGDFWLYETVLRQKPRRAEWQLGLVDAPVRYPAHGNLKVLSIARMLIEHPLCQFPAGALGYSRSDNELHVFRDRLLTLFQDLAAQNQDSGLDAMSHALGRCLIHEDGNLRFEPRPGIRFRTRIRAVYVTKAHPDVPTGVASPHGR